MQGCRSRNAWRWRALPWPKFAMSMTRSKRFALGIPNSDSQRRAWKRPGDAWIRLFRISRTVRLRKAFLTLLAARAGRRDPWPSKTHHEFDAVRHSTSALHVFRIGAYLKIARGVSELRENLKPMARQTCQLFQVAIRFVLRKTVSPAA
jgi:hypothetical protein